MHNSPAICQLDDKRRPLMVKLYGQWQGKHLQESAVQFSREASVSLSHGGPAMGVRVSREYGNEGFEGVEVILKKIREPLGVKMCESCRLWH